MRRSQKLSEVRIRNVDAAAIAKIDQLAKASNFKSRNAYLKHYIETLSVLEDLKEQENRYMSLVSNISEILKNQTATIESMKLKLERLENIINEK